MDIRRFVGWLWLLSGLPIGLALVALPPTGRLLFFTAAVFLETGHSLSPIIMAWTHRGFRLLMLSQPGKYLVLPSAVFALAFGVGIMTSLGWTSYVPGPYHSRQITDLRNPFPILVWVYLIWNGYHFGMQNFGVLSLCRHKPRSARRRQIDMFLCLAGTALGMYALPMLAWSQSLALLCVGVFSFNHWLVAIGLSSRVSRHTWGFIAAILVAGTVGFVWMIPTSNGPMIRVIPIIICARMGLGFVHFLYDRWVWKLSDPLVRATIGRDLLKQKEAGS
jgi:hypothetical protein